MKSISVGELRQNPTAMIADVEAGEVYELTRHQRRVGLIIPATPSAQLLPPRRTGRARTSELPVHRVRTAGSVDELLEDQKGPW
ncbi:hypothetical protein TEK04_07705 [Klenkia sp. LSe6-5]|uniref:Antitoxin n=1 Tax=Klenkia sesuvii TaxID=3103137 RepID=A0ABU8DU84_9ACTN